MNILVLSPDYPNKRRESFAFVKQLVDALAEKGNNCYVIAPYSVTRRKSFNKRKETIKTISGGTITIDRPNYISFSNFHIGKFRPSTITHRAAYIKAMRCMEFVPDLVYGHFWWCGLVAFDYARNHKLPLFVATGESIVPKMQITPKTKEFFNYVSGVICVSSKNKNESIGNGMTSEDKCLLALNSVNANLFKTMDKQKCRLKLGFPSDVFIVAFTGWFKPVKGPERVAKAIDMIKGTPVHSIFIGGNGPENPQCRNILFKGELAHKDIPEYLNAADVFVLPTLHEGLCNSIVEAMACGLPIISSDLPFNWDILNESNSILIDPNNIEEMAMAICKLRDNKDLRQKLSQGSLLMAKELTLDKRVEKIENFLQEKVREFKQNAL